MARTAYILIVDDERPIAGFVAEALTDEGYASHVVYDGASAVVAVRDHPPDLIILDVGLPVMTGDEVLRTLRSSGFNALPIIVVTAASDPHRFLAQGATAALKKPFDLDDLLRTVQRALASLQL